MRLRVCIVFFFRLVLLAEVGLVEQVGQVRLGDAPGAAYLDGWEFVLPAKPSGSGDANLQDLGGLLQREHRWQACQDVVLRCGGGSSSQLSFDGFVHVRPLSSK
jgi:hypothetical protein